MKRAYLPAKLAGETIKAEFDFAGDLAVGETIATQVCTASVYSGTDAAPASIISGAASASGTLVTQAITAGLAGLIYKVICTITTSAGQTLQQQGYLAVIPGLP